MHSVEKMLSRPIEVLFRPQIEHTIKNFHEIAAFIADNCVLCGFNSEFTKKNQ
jgi:hypothetical protein